MTVNSVTVNGNTYDDSSDPDTGLANGGARKRFVPLISDTLVEIATQLGGAASGFVATSTSSATIGAGAKTLNIETNKGFAPGQYVVAYKTSDPSQFMGGIITGYTSGAAPLAFTVLPGDYNGSGAVSAWTVVLAGKRGQQGVVGRSYEFDSATTSGDPGNGILRFSSGTVSAATAIYIDNLDYGATDVSGWLATLDDSTSAIKGTLTLRSQADPDRWVDYDVTATAAGSGFYTLTVTHIASSGSTPFADGDLVAVGFIATGDKGDAAIGIANPMTTAGDLIVGGSGGSPGRLAKGSDGQVLTIVSGALAWSAGNPMTTSGDMIYGGASGVQTRLPKGSDGQFLTLSSGLPGWASISNGLPRLTRTSNTKFDANAKGKWARYTAGGFTQTFDTAATLGADWFLYLTNASTADVEIEAPASVTVTSSTSIAITNTAPTFTVAAGQSITAGDLVIVRRTSDPYATRAVGTVTSYNGGSGALVLALAYNFGSGTYTDWTITTRAAANAFDGLASFVMYPGESRLIQSDGTSIRSLVLQAGLKVFTASDLFIQPPGLNALLLDGISGGAGGCSGSCNSGDANPATGGGGGGRLQKWLRTLPAAGSATIVTIGAGGTGRAGTSTNSTASLAGNDGGDTSFGSLFTVFGALGNTASVGGNGLGKNNTAIIQSVAVPRFGSVGGYQNSTAATVSYGAEWGGGGGGLYVTGSTATNDGGSSIYGAGGGGCSGGYEAGTPTTYLPSKGGEVGVYRITRTSGTGANAGTNGSTPTAGSDGATGNLEVCGGGGGGGGSGRAAGGVEVGANGGNGGIPGGGGGGGGASYAGKLSGSGGNGARGELRVYMA